MNGIFLINKEANWTSFDICAKVKRLFNTKKVGHSGTLDPFAEGLMIVCLGQATKIIPFLENYNKTYLATIKLGEETDTLDNTGNIIDKKDVLNYSIEELKNVLNSFLGKSQQIPPMYSALKHDGVPLYSLAREGIEIERKPRNIEMFSIELIEYNKPFLTFKCKVSKGTYIRTLAKDIAIKLSTVGHLVKLIRTNIDKFDLNMAKKVNELTINDSISIVEMLTLPTLIVDNEIEKKIRNGNKLSLQGKNMLLLVNEKKEALAIYEKKEDGYYYSKRGLFDANNNI